MEISQPRKRGNGISKKEESGKKGTKDRGSVSLGAVVRRGVCAH